ncbi:protein ABHD14A [Hemiscyllium ocellatum]|uniref:protein ABHD14A n=1 Tax=Hemiscyllium ocellatum TaxID=170820 RepID=UPI0029663232|nr:protein ABHD14A [Hemiscyllium ocellatum]XP_060691240.1 protein ABHD14A [Hemiscyllium ocellatum]
MHSCTFNRSRLLAFLLVVGVTLVIYYLLPNTLPDSTKSVGPLRAYDMTTTNKLIVTVNVTVEKSSNQIQVFYRETLPLQESRESQQPSLEVLLLHGQAFDSKTWEGLGTLSLLAEKGYRAVAMDLPGYGNTPLLDIDKVDKDRADFLLAFLNAVGLQAPVVVSPSMSGHFSIPFLMFYAQRLKGFVPIAPAGTNLYNADQYEKIQTPTLIVFGELDTNLGVQSLKNLKYLPHHSVFKIPTARHACYLDEPHLFHTTLLDFLTRF